MSKKSREMRERMLNRKLWSVVGVLPGDECSSKLYAVIHVVTGECYKDHYYTSYSYAYKVARKLNESEGK